MAKWCHSDLFDYGLDRPRAQKAAGNDVRLHVVKAYAAGDAYATVTGNSVGDAALATGDFALAAHATTGRKLTVAAKTLTASASSGASPDLHFAVVDATDSKVLLVTDETSDQVITSGNTLNTPAIEFLRFTQPT
jgi:hypothetical protein